MEASTWANVFSLLALGGTTIGLILSRRDVAASRIGARDSDDRAKQAVDAAERAATAQEQLGAAFTDFLARQEKRDQRQWSQPSMPMAREGTPYAGPGVAFGAPEPPPPVHWTVDRVQGKRYSLTNLGRGKARDVTVTAENTVRFEGPEDGITIEGHGSSAPFTAIGSWQSGTPEIIVHWTDDDGDHEWRRIVP